MTKITNLFMVTGALTMLGSVVIGIWLFLWCSFLLLDLRRRRREPIEDATEQWQKVKEGCPYVIIDWEALR
jgi:hypothetical protein